MNLFAGLLEHLQHPAHLPPAILDQGHIIEAGESAAAFAVITQDGCRVDHEGLRFGRVAGQAHHESGFRRSVMESFLPRICLGGFSVLPFLGPGEFRSPKPLQLLRGLPDVPGECLVRQYDPLVFIQHQQACG